MAFHYQRASLSADFASLPERRRLQSRRQSGVAVILRLQPAVRVNPNMRNRFAALNAPSSAAMSRLPGVAHVRPDFNTFFCIK